MNKVTRILVHAGQAQPAPVHAAPAWVKVSSGWTSSGMYNQLRAI